MTPRLVAFDIETSNGMGFGSLNSRDPKSSIALMQFAFEGEDPRVFRPGKSSQDGIESDGLGFLKSLIEERYTFIIHNASFELDWLREKHDLPIHSMSVWCSMTASQLLNAGKSVPDKASWVSAKLGKKNVDYVGRWEPLLREIEGNMEEAKKAKFTHNLQSVVYRYADGTIVEKDQGNSDWAGELNEEQIRYCKDDVRYLIQVARKQKEFVDKFNMSRLFALEMSLIPATVSMKNAGMKIDIDRWKIAAGEYREKAESLSEKLNKEMGMELALREGSVSLFGGVVPKAFNVSSPSQIAGFFGIESADEKHLRELVDSERFVSEILDYKEYFKIASTYGNSYLKFIDPLDGRIHSLLIQAETATGRYSSRSPNLQNIPRDMLKSFITVDEGNLLMTVDYSSMESRILAYMSGDDHYIEVVNSEDVHWENAKKIFGLSHDDKRSGVFSVRGKTLSGDALRGMAKGVSFG